MNPDTAASQLNGMGGSGGMLGRGYLTHSVGWEVVAAHKGVGFL